jgi:hypothetical protein
MTPPQVGTAQKVTLNRDALELLKAASEAHGDILLIRSLGGEHIQVGRERFGDNTPRSRAKWNGALSELRTIGAVEHMSEHLDRITAVGYALVDEVGKSTPASSAFDNNLESHTKLLLDTLTYMNRDLLRFLLLKGGSARGDVVSSAYTSSAPFDFNALCKPIQEKGFIRRVDDHVEGHPMLHISEQLTETLKKLLFPRDEGNSTPFFKDILLARS